LLLFCLLLLPVTPVPLLQILLSRSLTMLSSADLSDMIDLGHNGTVTVYVDINNGSGRLFAPLTSDPALTAHGYLDLKQEIQNQIQFHCRNDCVPVTDLCSTLY
jgi:hypothetical protein